MLPLLTAGAIVWVVAASPDTINRGWWRTVVKRARTAVHSAKIPAGAPVFRGNHAGFHRTLTCIRILGHFFMNGNDDSRAQQLLPRNLIDRWAAQPVVPRGIHMRPRVLTEGEAMCHIPILDHRGRQTDLEAEPAGQHRDRFVERL